jgi:hypothetical protein
MARNSGDEWLLTASFFGAFFGGGFLGLFIWVVCFLVFFGVAFFFNALAGSVHEQRQNIRADRVRQELGYPPLLACLPPRPPLSPAQRWLLRIVIGYCAIMFTVGFFAAGHH